jgi:hypothetical protein
LDGFRAELYRPVSTESVRSARVVSTAAATAGTAALAAWVVGVSGAFGPTANWTLFSSGLVLLLVARLRWS